MALVDSSEYSCRAGDMLVRRSTAARRRVAIGEVPGTERPNAGTVIAVAMRLGVELPRHCVLAARCVDRQAVDGRSAGTTIQQLVEGERSAGLPVPLPPLAEQERIVAAIEEHLSRLDAAEARCDVRQRTARDAGVASRVEAFDLDAPSAVPARRARATSRDGIVRSARAEPTDDPASVPRGRECRPCAG